MKITKEVETARALLDEPKNHLAKQKQLKNIPESKSGITPTRETWKSAKLIDAQVAKLNITQKRVSEALNHPSQTTLKNPDQNSMRVEVEWDTRKKPRAEYRVTIRSGDGLGRAEMVGTKSGKTRTWFSPLNEEPDEDALDAEGKTQLIKAIKIAREAITEKEGSADEDSGPESGSDTSDEER